MDELREEVSESDRSRVEDDSITLTSPIGGTEGRMGHLHNHGDGRHRELLSLWIEKLFWMVSRFSFMYFHPQ